VETEPAKQPAQQRRQFRSSSFPLRHDSSESDCTRAGGEGARLLRRVAELGRGIDDLLPVDIRKTLAGEVDPDRRSGEQRLLGAGRVVSGRELEEMDDALSLDAPPPEMMDEVLIKGYVAAVFGGLYSIPGAIVGALLIGVAENLAGGYLGSHFKTATAFVMIVVLLAFRPQGLFGIQKRREI